MRLSALIDPYLCFVGAGHKQAVATHMGDTQVRISVFSLPLLFDKLCTSAHWVRVSLIDCSISMCQGLHIDWIGTQACAVPLHWFIVGESLLILQLEVVRSSAQTELDANPWVAVWNIRKLIIVASEHGYRTWSEYLVIVFEDEAHSSFTLGPLYCQTFRLLKMA